MRSSAAATRHVVGAVAEGDIEGRLGSRPALLRARPAHERCRARRQSERLGAQALAAVAPDRRVRDAKALAQLERLGEVARGHAHVVAVRSQALDHGAHDQHVRAVREIDPDAHGRRTLTICGDRAWIAAMVGRLVLVIASISESLVNETSHLVRDGGLPGIFALMAISSACIPIPSEVVMLFAGFAVADPGQSASHHHLTMVGIVLAGLLGTMVGSWVTYAVGRGGRLELLERHGAKCPHGPDADRARRPLVPALRRGCGAVRASWSRSCGRSCRCPPGSRRCRSCASPCSR